MSGGISDGRNEEKRVLLASSGQRPEMLLEHPTKHRTGPYPPPAPVSSALGTVYPCLKVKETKAADVPRVTESFCG